jgi:hypothetical protein
MFSLVVLQSNFVGFDAFFRIVQKMAGVGLRGQREKVSAGGICEQRYCVAICRHFILQRTTVWHKAIKPKQ